MWAGESRKDRLVDSAIGLYSKVKVLVFFFLILIIRVSRTSSLAATMSEPSHSTREVE